jgi:hypothetical protein
MILNLTQHPATAEQLAAGVVDLEGDALQELRTLLTFEQLPSGVEIADRAVAVARGARDRLPYDDTARAMIGGAPFFMAPLEKALLRQDIVPLYAFTQRVAVEEKQADGTVRKTQVFRHEGWVPALGDEP